jgi:C4-dicarboxylate-specific signal transduction histidine kinase
VTAELIRSRTHPEDISSFYDVVDRASAGAHHYEYERRLKMPDQTVKYIHVVAHGTRDKDGRLEYIGAVQDVTERRLSEQALDKARSELARMARLTSLGALTASIAHEVNQPLLGIVTNASTCLRMLAADPPNVEGAQETARFLVSDGHRASDVIKRLRGLFSKKSTTMELVDLSEATQEVVALSLGELRRNRVIVRTACAHELPPVHGDRVQLQQVVLNLLLNASEAMIGVADRPKQLLVKTDLDEDGNVRLTVQDAGVGIQPNDMERLFEAFYTTKTDGMGIGLSISRSIIESHGGRIWAEPNSPGPGATFSFALPRAPEDAMNALGLDVLQPAAAVAAGASAGNL